MKADRRAQIEEAAFNYLDIIEIKRDSFLRERTIAGEAFMNGARFADSNPVDSGEVHESISAFKRLDGVAAVNLSEPSPGDLERVVSAYAECRKALEAERGKVAAVAAKLKWAKIYRDQDKAHLSSTLIDEAIASTQSDRNESTSEGE